MPDLTIRRLTLGDLALAERALLDIHLRPACPRGALAGFLIEENAYLLVALDAGHLVGSLNGYRLARPSDLHPGFLLYEIDVLEERQREGIGAALVEGFKAEARRAGAREIWVLTNDQNEAAMGLYKSCGGIRETEDDVLWVFPL